MVFVSIFLYFFTLFSLFLLQSNSFFFISFCCAFIFVLSFAFYLSVPHFCFHLSGCISILVCIVFIFRACFVSLFLFNIFVDVLLFIRSCLYLYTIPFLTCFHPPIDSCCFVFLYGKNKYQIMKMKQLWMCFSFDIYKSIKFVVHSFVVLLFNVHVCVCACLYVLFCTFDEIHIKFGFVCNLSVKNSFAYAIVCALRKSVCECLIHWIVFTWFRFSRALLSSSH